MPSARVGPLRWGSSTIRDIEQLLGEAVTKAEFTDDPLESIVVHLSGALQNRRAVEAAATKIESSAESAPGAASCETSMPADGWSVAQWVESLKLDNIVSRALAPPAGAEEQLAFAHALTFTKAQQLLTRAGIETQIATALARAADEMRNRGGEASVSTLGSHSASLFTLLTVSCALCVVQVSTLNTKFAQESSFELSVGSLDVFYGGLDKLVGPPRMISGSLLLAMEAEHCKARDANEAFSPSNGPGMDTTSAIEWAFVVTSEAHSVYPERDDIRRQMPARARKPWTRAELEHRMQPVNGELCAAGHVPLILEEAVGVRLYTGPSQHRTARTQSPFARCIRPERRIHDGPCIRIARGRSV